MDNKEQLKNMLDAIVNKNTDSAKVTFHSYLQDKFKSLMNPGPIEDVQPEVEVPVEEPTSDE
jgi:hypothetical protein